MSPCGCGDIRLSVGAAVFGGIRQLRRLYRLVVFSDTTGQEARERDMFCSNDRISVRQSEDTVRQCYGGGLMSFDWLYALCARVQPNGTFKKSGNLRDVRGNGCQV